MNFFKWFSFLLALGLFIWFVFFRWNVSASNAIASDGDSDIDDTEVFDDNNTDDTVVDDTDDSFVDETEDYVSVEEGETADNSADNDDAFIEDESTSDESTSSPNNNDNEKPSSTTPKADDTIVEGKINESAGFDYSKKFLIVVGSFGVEANAHKMKNRVINDGRRAEVKMINGLHRVIVEATDDRTNARQVRDHFTLIYKERAFILNN